MDKEVLQKLMIEEIQIIQGNIKRMATNSFMIKGWTVTLVIASLLFKGDKFQIIIAFIPLIIFWILDAYFLRQEKLYIELYEWVISNRLNTEDHLLSMKANRFNRNVKSLIGIIFSFTLSWFYLSIAIMIITYTLYLFFISCHSKEILLTLL